MYVSDFTNWQKIPLITQRARTVIFLGVFLACRLFACAQESICVRVKIEIDQELTLERQGFEARMNIKNGGAVDLESLSAVLNFLDENNSPVVATSDPNSTTAKFFVRLTSSATLPNRVAGNGEEKLRWLIVPAPASAGSDPVGTLYFVGAKLTYTSSGVESVIDVTPDSIRVSPMALLTLDYFLPYDVYGDDPFTPYRIEPSIPFNLGVRVKNSGFGTARKVKIESSQPKIIENRQGLLINFHIEGSEVNGQPATPSLLVDLGDIASNRSGVARWIMTSSLYGRFVEFNATFTHADELGGQLTSLISEIRTHTLIHDVLVDLPGRDAVRDFLAVDDQAMKVYESDNTDTLVSYFASSAAGGALANEYNVSVPPETGFFYVKMFDPRGGRREISAVRRSDGKVINVNNAWLSSTYLPDALEWNYFVNIFDGNNPNGFSYRLIYGEPVGGNHAPVLRKPLDRVTRAGVLTSFLVQASDPDDDPVTLTATSLPAGATFTVLGLGVGRFAWTPAANQTGSYAVQFSASDGRLVDQKTTVIQLTGGSLLKGWREHYWPGITDLSVTGNGVDWDKDGLKNLIEYALGLDPTRSSVDGLPIPGMVEFGGETFATLTYVGRTDDPNLRFDVIGSSSLLAPDPDWQLLTETVPVDQSEVPTGFHKVSVRDGIALDGTPPKRFLKLRVTTTEAE